MDDVINGQKVIVREQDLLFMFILLNDLNTKETKYLRKNLSED